MGRDVMGLDGMMLGTQWERFGTGGIGRRDGIL